MFYNANINTPITEQELIDQNLDIQNLEMLKEYGYYPLKISEIQYDPLTQGLEPSGEPYLTADDVYIQDMKIVDILQTFKNDKKADVTTIRKAKEIGPIITTNGYLIDSSTESRSKLQTTLAEFTASDIDTIDFKTVHGWATVTQDELTTIVKDINEHIQACFSHERYLHELIDLCTTPAELNDIDTDNGWPDYSDRSTIDLSTSGLTTYTLPVLDEHAHYTEINE